MTSGYVIAPDSCSDSDISFSTRASRHETVGTDGARPGGAGKLEISTGASVWTRVPKPWVHPAVPALLKDNVGSLEGGSDTLLAKPISW